MKKLDHDKKTTEEKRQKIIAAVMLFSIICAIVAIIFGELLSLSSMGQIIHIPHVFDGEPRHLRDILLIIKSAFSGNVQSVIQLGILLLLVNPIVRVIAVLYEFFTEKNKLYIIISLIVLSILLISFLNLI